MASFKRLVLGAAFMVSVAVSSFVPANAQTVPYDRNLILKLPSTNDEIGIAFLKTAANFPDFAKVVEDSETYKKMNPLAQQDYVAKMTQKLQSSYASFVPGKTDLIVRMEVSTLFEKLKNEEGIIKIRTFPNDPVYFPFYFAKYPIAMILKDMEQFREIRMNSVETAIANSRLAISGNATLLLQLYTIAADDRKAIMLDNIPQYPLLVEIGYIGLLNRQGEQIWAWRNEKYGKGGVKGGDGRTIMELRSQDRK